MELALLFTALLAAQQKHVGAIDFFGYGGLETEAVRLALPFHEGDIFPAGDSSMTAWKQRTDDAVVRITGRPATDVAMVCCNDAGNWLVYIGLAGRSARVPSYHPAPTGTGRLPPALIRLDAERQAAWSAAVRRGASGEEHATGYALSIDPALRSRQLELRRLALQYEKQILSVISGSADASQRRVAATALGYSRQSGAQIDALVRAASDPDGEVRNNAVRALGVLASARPELRERIPPAVCIDLLRSGMWTDRNKGSLLLLTLTEKRDDALLAELRSLALEPLLEMARWRFSGHADPVRVLLGRIAGIEESRLQDLIRTGQVDTILESVRRWR